MSSPEMEQFEITDRDLDDELNPYRKRHRQSKKQAIYGIWADEDSDDEGRPTFGNRRGKKDYSAPVGFVSGGIKGEEKPSGSKAGNNEDEESYKDDKGTSSESDDGGGRVGFGVKPQPSGAATIPGAARNYDPGLYKGDRKLGTWEKHTKGIGAKLLGKMGHVHGRGLGKNLQGIVNPVEAQTRKGKAAVGFYGSERTKSQRTQIVDQDEQEEVEFKEKLRQWKKTDDRKKKPKYNYVTADEVIASGGIRKKKHVVPSELSKVKVIDMTGKEKRVLSSYSALAQRHDRPDDDEDIYDSLPEKRRAFDMPELMHNLNMLVDMAEEEIITNDRRLKHSKDLAVNLTFEQEKLTEVLAQESKQIDKLQKICDMIESCEARLKEGAENPLTLSECAKTFIELQDAYYEEYKLFELSNLAIAMITPLMKKHFEAYSPLIDSTWGLETMKSWKDILHDGNRSLKSNENDMDAYDKLVWDIWMPYVRRAVGSWNVRTCDPVIELLENWLPILSPWIMDNILDLLVYPRLQSEVENWNPTSDTVPIHSWLHPWLPLMGERLEPLYAPIRQKLGTALINWHPSDPSAKLILQPWLNVFKKGHVEAFVLKHILSKLHLCMQEFVINPHQQHLDPWNWVMSWREIIPNHNMIVMLEKTFFPKWLQVLSSWLNSNPNYDEVTKWYMGWKSMMPEEFFVNQSIKDQFNQALSMMNRAVTGHYQPGARENVAYLTHQERRRDFEPTEKREREPTTSSPTPTMKVSDTATTIPHSFKELIEKKAMENNILFAPIPNRTQEARQVYRFGKVSIYIDRRVVFMFTGEQWIPVSLNSLIERAIG
ncbi:tuftelin-interacting protein 11-like [Lineus longissimus]|uniref:tuftelin-interacting protein 11-like n=1 Tax=Lineus longissimus TaxID=88925 RepID=UPI002B4D6E75